MERLHSCSDDDESHGLKSTKNGAEAIDSPPTSPYREEKLETSSHFSDQNGSEPSIGDEAPNHSDLDDELENVADLKTESGEEIDSSNDVSNGPDESFEEEHEPHEEVMTIESAPLEESFNESETCVDAPSDRGSDDECSRSGSDGEKVQSEVQEHDDSKGSYDEEESLSAAPGRMSDDENNSGDEMEVRRKSTDESLGFAVTEDYNESIKVDDPNDSTGFSVSGNCSDDEELGTENTNTKTMGRDMDISYLDHTVKSPEGNINETITSYSFVESPKSSESSEHEISQDSTSYNKELFCSDEENKLKSPTEPPESEYPEEHKRSEQHSYVQLHEPISSNDDHQKQRSGSPEGSEGQEPYSPLEQSGETSEHMEVDNSVEMLSENESLAKGPRTPEQSDDILEDSELKANNVKEVSSEKMVLERDLHMDDNVGPRTPTGPEPCGSLSSSPSTLTNMLSAEPASAVSADLSFESNESEDSVPPFEMMTENKYVSASKQRSRRDKKMICSCDFTAEDPATHCADTCLNKVLMIECNSKCPCGDLCKNKKFQKADYAKCEPFNTGSKGWGLKAAQDILPGDFVMEYCGEVVNQSDFKKRMETYGNKRTRHYYFMTISKDEIIDAHNKGNQSRFINHSCEPNCETQKWRVNGVLRIGFFAIKRIKKGTELCFDYQYQRYGEDVQTCYCGSEKCRGTLGEKLSDLAPKPPSPETSSPKPGKQDKVPETKKKDTGSFEQSLSKITQEDGSLSSPDNALQLSRLMVQTDTVEHRQLILKTIQCTKDASALKRFLNYQGLNILWSWMVDVNDTPSSQRAEFKLDIIKALQGLPISTKNAVEDSKVIKVLKKWLDIEQSSSSSQADSSEEGVPVQEERAVEGTVAEEGGVVEEGGVAVETSVAGEEDAAEEGNIVEEGTEESVPGEQSPPLPETETDVNVLEVGHLLLNQWNSLKEVFKIPKKDKAPPRNSGPATFSLGTFLTGLSNPSSPSSATDGAASAAPTTRKLPLDQADYELPTSFGSTKREYSDSSRDTRDSKRRRDDRGSSRDDRGSSRDDRGSNRDDRGSNRDDRGSSRDDRGSNRDDRGSNRDDRGNSKDDRGSSRGGRFTSRFSDIQTMDNTAVESLPSENTTDVGVPADKPSQPSFIPEHKDAPKSPHPGYFVHASRVPKTDGEPAPDNLQDAKEDEKVDETKKDGESRKDESRRDEKRDEPRRDEKRNSRWDDRRDDRRDERRDDRRDDRRDKRDYRRDEGRRDDRGRSDRGRYDRGRDYKKDYDSLTSEYSSRFSRGSRERTRDDKSEERRGSKERRSPSKERKNSKEKHDRSSSRDRSSSKDITQLSIPDPKKVDDAPVPMPINNPPMQLRPPSQANMSNQPRPTESLIRPPLPIQPTDIKEPIKPDGIQPQYGQPRPPAFMPGPGSAPFPEPANRMPRFPPGFNPRNAGSFPRFAGSMPMFKPRNQNDKVRSDSLDPSIRPRMMGNFPDIRTQPPRQPMNMRYRSPLDISRHSMDNSRPERPRYDYKSSRPPMMRPRYEQWSNAPMPYRYPSQQDARPNVPDTAMTQRPPRNVNSGVPQPIIPQHRLPQHGLNMHQYGMSQMGQNSQFSMPNMQQDMYKHIPEQNISGPGIAPPMPFPPQVQGVVQPPNMGAHMNSPSLGNTNNTIASNLDTSSLASLQGGALPPQQPSLPQSSGISSAVPPALPKEPEGEKRAAVLKTHPPVPQPAVLLTRPEDKKLPPHWRTAKDAEGKTYYYHAITRETQWDAPVTEDTSGNKKLDTPSSPTPKKQPPQQQPTQQQQQPQLQPQQPQQSQQPPKKMKREESPPKHKPSTSVKVEPEMDASSKKALADFKSQLAKIVVNNLGKYNKVDCKVGRIMDSSDFKYVARKLTHGLTEKELQRKGMTELNITDSLKQRVKLYISAYMSKFGPIYHKT